MSRALILFLLAVCLGGYAYGAMVQVQVRVIQANKARPRPGVRIYVHASPGHPPFQITSLGWIETDQSGLATILVEPETHPRLFFGFNGLCSSPGPPPVATYDTATILNTGITGENHCDHKSPKLKDLAPATPGEVVFFWESQDFWWKLRHRNYAP